MNSNRGISALARILLGVSLAIVANTDLIAFSDCHDCEGQGMWGQKFPPLQQINENFGRYHEKEVAEISSAAGVTTRFAVYPTGNENFNDALATIENGRRVIYIGRGMYWAPEMRDKPEQEAKLLRYIVLAHEIGHHVLEHASMATVQPKLELEADWFAGCALGFNTNKNPEEWKYDVEDIMKFYEAKHGEDPNRRLSERHPPFHEREIAFRDGWMFGWNPARRPSFPESPCEKSNVLLAVEPGK